MKEEELKEFEEGIKDLFLDAKIKSPVHLAVGSEGIVKVLKPKWGDWIFTNHRSHYHALIAGVDKEWLKNEILENRSIHIYSKEHKVFASAIMAGNLPIAIGVAMAIKRKKGKEHVWAICGDMTAEMGIFHECTKYAAHNNLPITFIVEDNGLSVNTPTMDAWGKSIGLPNIVRYTYERKYPHQGAGQWVVF